MSLILEFIIVGILQDFAKYVKSTIQKYLQQYLDI